MGVRWASVMMVVVAALGAKVQCILEDSLPSVEPLGKDKSITRKEKPMLSGFDAHAEDKALASGGEIVIETPATELPEPLPIPVAVKQKKPEVEPSDTEKKLSVPSKRISSKKSSVVPKKEGLFIPSVVAKKGADPESSTPSVSPRKGADPESSTPSVSPRKGADPESSTPSVSPRKGAEPYQMDLGPSQSSQVHSLPLASSENMNNTYVSPLPSYLNHKNTTIRLNETINKASDEKETMENLDNLPVPQLVQKAKANDTLIKGNILQSLSDSSSTLSPVLTPKSASVGKIGHFKPTTADDAGVASSQLSYAPIFMIVALVLLVVVVVGVAYHKLKDIWIRRHYDYVDFLIDGMYE